MENKWEIKREDNEASLENEQIQVLLEDANYLINQIKKDIEEIGGEEEFESALAKDPELSYRKKVWEEKAFKTVAGIYLLAMSYGFGNSSIHHIEGENVLDVSKSLMTAESLVSLGFLGSCNVFYNNNTSI